MAPDEPAVRSACKSWASTDIPGLQLKIQTDIHGPRGVRKRADGNEIDPRFSDSSNAGQVDTATCLGLRAAFASLTSLHLCVEILAYLVFNVCSLLFLC